MFPFTLLGRWPRWPVRGGALLPRIVSGDDVRQSTVVLLRPWDCLSLSLPRAVGTATG